MKLSVTVITLNEEKQIAGCLASVQQLADEVIVVDCGSTDKTVEIAQQFGSKVYFRIFDNFANQKNFAAGKAGGDWILSLDADEKVTPGLSSEISEKLGQQDLQVVAFSIPRKNYILGKFIRHTRWQPELDRHVWLWKKNKGKWIGEVHEEVIVEGKVGKLKNPKIHYQYETVSLFFDMMNNYSEIEARQNIARGTKFSYFHLFLDPPYNLLVRYIYRLGFLDGWRGFVLSFLMAIYHFEVNLKVWQLGRSV